LDEIYCLYFSFVLIFIMLYTRDSVESTELILISLFGILGIIALSVVGGNTLFVIIGIIIAGFNLKLAIVEASRNIGK